MLSSGRRCRSPPTMCHHATCLCPAVIESHQGSIPALSRTSGVLLDRLWQAIHRLLNSAINCLTPPPPFFWRALPFSKGFYELFPRRTCETNPTASANITSGVSGSRCLFSLMIFPERSVCLLRKLFHRNASFFENKIQQRINIFIRLVPPLLVIFFKNCFDVIQPERFGEEKLVSVSQHITHSFWILGVILPQREPLITQRAVFFWGGGHLYFVVAFKILLTVMVHVCFVWVFFIEIVTWAKTPGIPSKTFSMGSSSDGHEINATNLGNISSGASGLVTL